MVMDDALMERLVDRLLDLQGEESFDLRLFQKQLAEVEKGIENMLNAIQAGILTASTKERLAALEAQKAQLEESVLRERIKRPVLTREQIAFFLRKFRDTNTADEEERQRLIDCFVNAVFVFEDKIVLTFNYKDGTKTISLDDVESSDLEGFGPPICIDKKDADKNPTLQCGIFAYKIKKLKAIKNNFLTFEKSGGVK